MNFLMLSKDRLPSLIAIVMVAKLSSNRIMSLACFATSVPLIPMEIPMSDFFRARASFTPSPVIATRESSFNISRIFSL